jgi:hypothetical protein
MTWQCKCQGFGGVAEDSDRNTNRALMEISRGQFDRGILNGAKLQESTDLRSDSWKSMPRESRPDPVGLEPFLPRRPPVSRTSEVSVKL